MKQKGDINLTDEIKEKVKIMSVQGHSIEYIAKALDISNDSVHKIRKQNDNFEELRSDKKRQIIEKLWDIAINCLNSIDYKKLKTQFPSMIMTTAAIAIDKAQLLTGGVTERLGFVNEQEIDSKLAELETAEKELQEAWERAEKNREKAAEVKVDVPKS